MANREQENNGSFDDANALSNNILTNGRISRPEDIDYFKFNILRPTQFYLQFDTSREEDDQSSGWLITILNESEQIINRVTAYGDRELYGYVNTAGTYYIKVESLDDKHDGSEYGLTVERTIGLYYTGYEPNEDFATASPMDIGPNYGGNIYGSDDEDFYQFRLDGQDNTISLNFSHPLPIGIYPFKIVLYNEDKQVVSEKSFFFDGTLTYSTEEKGKFYFKIESDYDWTTLYVISVSTSKEDLSISNTTPLLLSSLTNSSDTIDYDNFNQNQLRAVDGYYKNKSSTKSNEDNYVSIYLDGYEIIDGTDSNEVFILPVEHSNNGCVIAKGAWEVEINNFDISNDTIILQSTGDPDFSSDLKSQSLKSAPDALVSYDAADDSTIIYFTIDVDNNSGYLKINGINDDELEQINIIYEDLVSSSKSNFSDNSELSNEPPAFLGDNIIVPNANAVLSEYPSGYFDAGKGNDTYILTSSIQKNNNIKIRDSLGTNSIELVDGFAFKSAEFSSTTLKFNLQNNATILIEGADKFIYSIGGNTTSGTKGNDVNFLSLAKKLGITSDLPNETILRPSGDTVLKVIKTKSDSVSGKKFTSEGVVYSLAINQTSADEGESLKLTITGDEKSEFSKKFNYEIEPSNNSNTVEKGSEDDLVTSLTGEINLSGGSLSTSLEIIINEDQLQEGIEGFKITILDENNEIIGDKIFLINDVYDESSTQSYKLSSSLNVDGPILTDHTSNFNNTGKGVVNYTSLNDIIILTGQNDTVRGLAGDDIYFLSDLIPSSFSGSIVDTTGNNVIQIPENTLITKVQFAADAARIFLDNDKLITINGADRFTYDLSGNSLNGNIGEKFTYPEFVDLFEVDYSLIGTVQTASRPFYTKSESKSGTSSYEIVNISSTINDSTIVAKNTSEDFRYEILAENSKALSLEGNFDIKIKDFDYSKDKLTLVNQANLNITFQEFKNYSGVDIGGNDFDNVTTIYFSPDSAGSSGSLTIQGIYDKNFEKITFRIVSESNLDQSSLAGSYKKSNSLDTSKYILESFNNENLTKTLNVTNFDDIIIITNAETSRGLAGDDLYFISNLFPKNSSVNIVDTNGSNIIQFPDNTYIDKILFTKDSFRVTLEDSRIFTISGADSFRYDMGGNFSNGEIGKNMSYTEFAFEFGISDVLSLTSTETGIADFYII